MNTLKKLGESAIIIIVLILFFIVGIIFSAIEWVWPNKPFEAV